MIQDDILKRYSVESIESRMSFGTPREQAEEDMLRNFLCNTDYISNKLAEAQFLGTEVEDYSEVLRCRENARTRINELMKLKEAIPFEEPK